MLQRQLVYFLKYSLLLIGCLSFFFSFANDQTNIPLAKNGILDLRQIDLHTTTVPLNGEWEFYWKQLANPGETENLSVAYGSFPALWNNTTVNGSKLPNTGYASYRLRVLLPKNYQQQLAIQIPDTYCSYKLFLNGMFFAAAGNPGTDKKTTVPKWVIRTEVLPVADTLDLLLQVANFHHAKGGAYKEIRIGSREKLFIEKDTETGFDLLLTGCLFMGGFFFLGLFLFGKHDKVILYFSLFCIVYSYRIIGSKNYVLHNLFPELPWSVSVHLEYLSLFISLLFFIFYTRELYPKETNKYLFYAEVSAATLISLFVLFSPTTVFTSLMSPFLVLMFSVIAHVFYIYYRAFSNNQLGAKYALGSTAVLLINFALINLQYFGVIDPPKLVIFTGYVSFFFLQSLILSFRFAFILKEAKKQAEQGLVAKNEFLSTMSHEIRTPLNSILGMTQLMLRDKHTEEQKEQLDVLMFSANNLLSIVNDILDYNKIEAGKISFEMVKMDIRSIARNIITGLKTIADEKHIELKLQIDPAISEFILGDPTRTGQVIGNLVHNAIKFTRKGYVLLELKVTDKTADTITILTRIEDTGIGIATEKQKIIFEQFTQADTSTSRNFGGTGLGLAICKKLLDLQGARLQLESQPEKGSVFFYTLSYPIVPASESISPETVESLPPEESRPLSNVPILLVEDNEVNVLVAKTFLERWGAVVDVAQNGQFAIDMLDPERHRIILMDMHMPVMDGYEATRIIRSRGIKIPIIALTASLPFEMEAKIKNTGIDDIVVKPFAPRELYRVILHYTGIHRF